MIADAASRACLTSRPAHKEVLEVWLEGNLAAMFTDAVQRLGPARRVKSPSDVRCLNPLCFSECSRSLSARRSAADCATCPTRLEAAVDRHTHSSPLTGSSSRPSRSVTLALIPRVSAADVPHSTCNRCCGSKSRFGLRAYSAARTSIQSALQQSSSRQNVLMMSADAIQAPAKRLGEAQ
jgi:hypothetical protein